MQRFPLARVSAWLLMTIPFFMAGGCQRYRPQPLPDSDLLDLLEGERRPAADGDGAVTFLQVARWMDERGPEVRELRAEYAAAAAPAEVNTPWPNPTVEAGQNFGARLEPGAVHESAPFVALGFTIPWSGRIGRENDLHRREAARAWAETVARHRELYLDLRAAYARVVITRRQERALTAVAASADRALAVTRALVQAGSATALDVGQMALEAERARLDAGRSRRAVAEAEAELATLTGVAPASLANLADAELPALPDTVPSVETAAREALTGNAKLAVLRAAYDVAEARLRLEIARQYPDLQIGSSWDQEVGEDKRVTGIGVGIEIPVFDRNQQGVAEALRRRDAARENFLAESNRLMTEIERACRACALARDEALALSGTMLPMARRNVELARKSLDAGVIDVLQLLDVERAERALELEAAEAELSARAALQQLEQAIGRPMILYPGETPAWFPSAATEEAAAIPAR